MMREIFEALETDAAVPSTLRQMLHIYRTNAVQGTWPEAAREWQQVAEGVIEIRDHSGNKAREFSDLYNHWLPVMGRHCINETKPSAPIVGAQGAQAAPEDPADLIWQVRMMLAGIAKMAQDSHANVLRGSKLDKALQDISTQALQATEKFNVLFPLERLVRPSVQVFQEFTPVPLPPDNPLVHGIREAMALDHVKPYCVVAPPGPQCSTGPQGPQGCMTPPEGDQGIPGDQTDYISTPGDLHTYNPLINEENLRLVDRIDPSGLNWRDEVDRWKQHPLFIAIQKHHADRGNDRCWENDVELYRAAGLEPGDPQLPSYEEHCRMCDKYRAGLYGPHTPPPDGNTLPS